MSAITSITVQNTTGVQAVSDVPAEVVAQQILAVATDIGVDAAKTGMLSTVPIIGAVADAVARAAIPNLVVDPVFVSKHGDPLLHQDAVESLRRRIVPLATVVTPNLSEASGLAGFDVSTREHMQKAAEAIHSLGAGSVMVKGGHLAEEGADDVFFDGERMEWLAGERIDSSDTHGTGCVLSAAIAAYLARGEDLFEAVQLAKRFVTEAIRHAVRLGKGIGPVNPGWRWMEGPVERAGS
jgi:hydroxymethylpyrimidine/phosphomethylpyrimidine kinase